jgi:hypothetical protein
MTRAGAMHRVRDHRATARVSTGPDERWPESAHAPACAERGARRKFRRKFGVSAAQVPRSIETSYLPAAPFQSGEGRGKLCPRFSSAANPSEVCL